MKNLSTILFFALAMTGCRENNEIIETKSETDADINNIVTTASQYGNSTTSRSSVSPANTISYDGKNVKFQSFPEMQEIPKIVRFLNTVILLTGQSLIKTNILPQMFR